MERRETSPTIHPDQVLAKCANGQMETRLAVLVSGAVDLKESGVRSQEERRRFVRVIVLVLEGFVWCPNEASCAPREKRTAR